MAMVQMPELQNLDDMPCFPKDRRLAEVFMRGGVQAEAQERITIREEEQSARESSRQVRLPSLALEVLFGCKPLPVCEFLPSSCLASSTERARQYCAAISDGTE